MLPNTLPFPYSFSLYEGLESVFYPLIWFEVTTSIGEDPDMASDVRMATREGNDGMTHET